MDFLSVHELSRKPVFYFQDHAPVSPAKIMERQSIQSEAIAR